MVDYSKLVLSVKGEKHCCFAQVGEVLSVFRLLVFLQRALVASLAPNSAATSAAHPDLTSIPLPLAFGSNPQ